MTYPSESARAPRRVVVLGSTGSIGVNTLQVIRNLGERYDVVGLAAGRNVERLANQGIEWSVCDLAVCDESLGGRLKQLALGARVYAGPQAAEQLVEQVDADVLVAAIVGAAGLPATLAAIRKGMDVALANKETLIAAGELVIPMAKEHGAALVPIDSEHSAIFQCFQTQRGAAADNGRAIKRIVLTASGGPFRNTPLDEMRRATPEQALNHPTWKMGPKITIDSATMMNKALEIVEAHWLFGLGADQISVIIHPQSIAHSFVEFADNSVLAQLGPPDMKTPIQYALTWPHRAPGCSDAMDWSSLRQLDFEPPDPQRFPALDLAYRVIERGGTSGAVFNAANEAAVEAFLDHQIPFGRIVELVREALEAVKPKPVDALPAVLRADAAARRFVKDAIGR